MGCASSAPKDDDDAAALEVMDKFEPVPVAPGLGDLGSPVSNGQVGTAKTSRLTILTDPLSGKSCIWYELEIRTSENGKKGPFVYLHKQSEQSANFSVTGSGGTSVYVSAATTQWRPLGKVKVMDARKLSLTDQNRLSVWLKQQGVTCEDFLTKRVPAGEVLVGEEVSALGTVDMEPPGSPKGSVELKSIEVDALRQSETLSAKDRESSITPGTRDSRAWAKMQGIVVVAPQ